MTIKNWLGEHDVYIMYIMYIMYTMYIYIYIDNSGLFMFDQQLCNCIIIKLEYHR